MMSASVRKEGDIWAAYRKDRDAWFPQDLLEKHGPGLHHIRFTVPDFEEKWAYLEASGIENIASGTGVHVGSKWAYFDTTQLLEGVVVELRKRPDGSDGEDQWIVKD